MPDANVSAADLERKISELDPQVAAQMSTLCDRFTAAMDADSALRAKAAVAVYLWRGAFGDLARRSGLEEFKDDDPSLVALTLITLHLWV